MTFRTLILRSLQHHARAHLGVLLGATVGSAVLMGALLVGDSVRGSLRDMALARLGRIETALTSGDRLFRGALATEARLAATPVLALPGTASSADAAHRANRVQVYGVEESFWQLARPNAAAASAIAPDSVVLNQPLAEQLAAKVGDEVLLRVSKTSALSQEVSLTPREGQTVALRLRVSAIQAASQLGNFSLQANQIAPFNAFVNLALLQERAGATGRANLLLQANSSPPAAAATTASAPTAPASLATLNATLAQLWQLADAQLELRSLTNSPTIELRTPRIFLDLPAVRAALAVETNAQPVLTFLVNLLRAGERTTPYSMVTAAGAPLVPADLRDDEIVINQWLADDLKISAGADISLTYFQPDSGARLLEATNRFRVRSIVPLEMPWADRTLMPDFPGIAQAEKAGDWDAGFPLAHKVRKEDDDYWAKWRGTPKAFVTLNAGRAMWANRFGDTTAVRFPKEAGGGKESAGTNVGNEKRISELEKALLAKLAPEDFGLVFQPVREQALKASREGQDFGGLFIGFSFFLIVAACVLVALLFQFGIEQRAPEVGTLLALGFTPRQVRRLLLGEGAGLALLGALLGAAGAVGYARVMLRALSTVWREAVGTSDLHFHAEPATLAGGIIGSVLVAVFTLWLALRKQAQRPARELLAGDGGEEPTPCRSRREEALTSPAEKGQSLLTSSPTTTLAGGGGEEPTPCRSRREEALTSPAGKGQSLLTSSPTTTLAGDGGEEPTPCRSRREEALTSPAGKGQSLLTSAPTRAGRAGLVGAGGLFGALALVGYALVKHETAAAGLFFGAGALLLISALAFTSALLSRLESSATAAGLTLAGMGLRSATRRRRRSLATVAMLACGSFLIVSIGAFRLDENVNATQRAAGTGGFAFIGESALPITADLNTTRGRESLGLDAKALTNVSFVPFRVRDGDDASCLNLNRAQRPRLLGVKPELLAERGAFSFASVAKGLSAENPWRWLSAKNGANAAATTPNEVPGIADEASILWALGKKLGDTLEFVDERGQPFRVRLVGALANSILQGNIVIAEDAFTAHFPGESGHRRFLVDAPADRATDVAATLTRALRDTGLELTPATRRLAQFNAVQNTYLGTFQVLGGLGLLLGSVGLGVVVLRNVLERRGELALLLAVGFRPRSLQWLLVSEHGALLLLGLGGGVVAAAVAVLPALLAPGTPIPVATLGLTLGGVLVNGAVWTLVATALALRGNLLDALRNN